MAKKLTLPSYSEKRGWTGGDNRTLYAFTDRRTGRTDVHPGGGTGKKLLMHWGPEATVRLATRAEAEEHWQNPLHKGWTVAEGGVSHATKYGPKAAEKIEKNLHEFKQGTLRSSSGQKVTSRAQAIAIGLSEARRMGGRVPPPPSHSPSHSKMLKSPVVRVESVKMPNGSTAEIHIHHGKGGYGGVLVLSNGNELPMSLGVPEPETAAEAVRGAKKFLNKVYGKTN